MLRYINNIIQTYKSSYQLKELDSTDMIQTVIRKVSFLQDRWNRKATNIRRDQSREPDFSDLLKFFEYEVALLSDPSYSKDALSDTTQLKTNYASVAGKEKDSILVNCPICLSPHDIEECEQYTCLNVDERHKKIFQLRLCFGCLSPVSQEHNGKSCSHKRKCIVCQEEHLTTLHGGKGLSVHF